MNQRRAFACLAIVAVSCLGVGEDRAALDLEVGRASKDGTTVVVADGAAVVRSVEPDAVRLWANAPSLRVAIDRAVAGALTIHLANAMPGVTVTAMQSGVAVPVVVTPGARPTELDARLDAKPGRLDLAVAVADEAVVEPFRFGVFGDVQDAIDRVGDIYARMNAERGMRFVLIVGDLTERGHEDELARFERELRALDVPLFATLGNHELGPGGGGKPRYYAWYGRGSWSFVWKGARFTMLDSASATIADDPRAWLDGWLEAGRAQTHVVGMHIPPIDPIGARSGSFASRHEADALLERFAEGHVDLTVYGHVHSYYAFSNAGIPAFITGGGGAIPERMDGIGRHFMVFDVDPATQRILPSLVRVD